MRYRLNRVGVALATLLLVGTCLLSLSGCEHKEKVLDVETPVGGVEVQKSKNGDQVDVKVHGKDKP